MFIKAHSGYCDFCKKSPGKYARATDLDDRDICADCSFKAAVVFGFQITMYPVGHVANANPKPMLSHLFKKILDKDYKKMYKAGFIDKDGVLTSAGQGTIDAILIEKFKEDVVAAADEKIEEDKESK